MGSASRTRPDPRSRPRTLQARRTPAAETSEGAAEVPISLQLRLYGEMLRARYLDDRLTKLQRQGRVAFHVAQRGEEAAIVGAAAALEKDDWLVPCYREFAALLYRGAPLSTYLDQMFGNADDSAHGRQMPDHFHSRAHRCLSVSAPIGTQIPHAVGLAHAARLKGRDEVSLVFFGDGATSSNDFHAAMTFAGVLAAPVVFACRNNGYAISLPTERQCAAANLADKAPGYGMRGEVIDGNDVLAVYRATLAATERARHGEGPTFLELRTYRLGDHSTSDDARAYRPESELVAAKAQDPIPRLRRHLFELGVIDATDDEELQARVAAEIDEAIRDAEGRPPPALDTMGDGVYATPSPAPANPNRRS